MLVDIKPMYIKGLACYEGSMVAVAASLKREYQLAYLNTFGISYLNTEDDLIGDRIITTNEDFDKQIVKYCGIEMVAINNRSNFIETVNDLLDKNVPVGVETDAYYCPWSFEYQKNNFGHHFLIVDKSDNGYKCIDTTMYEKYYFIDYDDFVSGTKNIVRFDAFETYENFNYLSILKQSINCYKENDMIKQLNNFYKDYSNVNYEKEFASFTDSRWGCSLPKNIGFYIVGSIELYIDFIKHMASKIKSPYFPPLLENIEVLKKQWGTFYSLLLKIFYTQNELKYKEKSLNILEDIIDKYRIAFDFFKKIDAQIK